ncbi:LrgB family protein [Thalassotalea sp. 1_MG-2023]|uniref:LrgB family protein n=1 Tax=Thalassotalea sp. 1_MG-2023 TaxID=3062680 RepID=UPI0026E121E2|nr:LrgB family protein [Thalassotalea sp. 1_MG-2023]MDO6427475.1 LrgB family protein [Thalassotalea sp. 1_MG-2023]
MITILIYQGFVKLQNRLNQVWLNPMLFSVITIIALLMWFQIDYHTYQTNSQIITWLLQPAVVALGYPLYQQLHSMRSQWKSITILLTISASLVVIISFLFTYIITKEYGISVSIALKSITTPIALAITEQLNGNQAVTAFAIILAGLFGALMGVPWLQLIGVKSHKAQGIAVGAASHVLGTATISQLSFQHAAYGSLALIISATITAIISPAIIHQLMVMLS